MGHSAALKLAIDLVHLPSQVRSLRAAQLPDDILILLRILAGDEEATSEAAAWTGRSRGTVWEAAAFYVEQILLFPGADSYRVLGARPDATYDELRRNMALLIRRLHPDRDYNGEQAIFAARVTRAWSDLKTPERRAAYDRKAMAEKSLLRKNRGGHAQSKRRGANRRWGAPSDRLVALRRSVPDNGLLRRVFLLLFGGAVP